MKEIGDLRIKDGRCQVLVYIETFVDQKIKLVGETLLKTILKQEWLRLMEIGKKQLCCSMKSSQKMIFKQLTERL